MFVTFFISCHVGYTSSDSNTEVKATLSQNSTWVGDQVGTTDVGGMGSDIDAALRQVDGDVNHWWLFRASVRLW